MTFLGGVLDLLSKKSQERGPEHPSKSYIGNVLGGHRLDEQSGGHLKIEGFPRNSREIAQIVGGQFVRSMYVKRSDPEKD